MTRRGRAFATLDVAETALVVSILRDDIAMMERRLLAANGQELSDDHRELIERCLARVAILHGRLKKRIDRRVARIGQ